MRVSLFAMLCTMMPSVSVAETVTVDVWADNWFELYVDGQMVLQDSVPITTERSFNAETKQLDIQRPAQVAFVVKDFKENDTGLEYIGSRKQQMGDGGFIAQFRDASGQVIAATDRNTFCMVVHHAPVQTSCAKDKNPRVGQGACASRQAAEPAGWTAAGFDDAGWSAAHEYSERQVRPKQGYDRVRWDAKARLIWTGNLEQDNTILCRMTVN